MLISRDSAIWWVGLVGGVVTAVVANLDQFTWFSEDAQHWLTLAGVVVAAISGKLATSPLPGERAAAVGTATAKLEDAKDQLAKAKADA